MNEKLKKISPEFVYLNIFPFLKQKKESFKHSNKKNSRKIIIFFFQFFRSEFSLQMGQWHTIRISRTARLAVLKVKFLSLT